METTTTTTTTRELSACDLCNGDVQATGYVLLCQEHYKTLTRRIAELESGIHLPGWWCLAIRESGAQCGTFNGESKDKHTICRICEKPRIPPERLTYTRAHDTLLD